MTEINHTETNGTSTHRSNGEKQQQQHPPPVIVQETDDEDDENIAVEELQDLTKIELLELDEETLNSGAEGYVIF